MKEEDMNHLRQQDQNLRDALRQEEAELPQMSADLNARLMQRVGDEQPKRSRTVWRWMAAAACLLLIIGIGYTLLPQEQQNEPLIAQKTVESQTEAPKAEPEQEPQAEPEPQTELEPQAEEPLQKVAKAEVTPSRKPAKKQRKVVMKLVELIPTSETIDDADPVVVMTAQVEDIRQRGMRLHEEIRQQMKN